MSIVKATPAKSESREAPAAQPQGKRRGGAAPALAVAPRADLLPPEIGQVNRQRGARRGMRVVVVVAAVVAVLGVVGAWQYATAAQAQLASAQQQTQELAVEKGKYADVSKTLSGISVGTAAVEVGGSTDIDWSDYLSKLEATLPSGVTLKTVSVESADISSAFEQSDVPLEGARIATITFTADSDSIPSIPEWVDGLSTLPGFADASPDKVTQQDTGSYESQVTMHVNTEAYSHRFDSTKGGSK